MWSSQGGSLLLWAWVLSIAASGVLYLTRNRHREVVPWATAVLAGIGLFFTVLMLLAAASTRSSASTRRRPRASGSTRCCATR